LNNNKISPRDPVFLGRIFEKKISHFKWIQEKCKNKLERFIEEIYRD